MNGWTQNNFSVRNNVIDYLSSDIYFISETHLCDNNQLYNYNNMLYEWFCYNRDKIHKNGSGGIGMLIKLSCLKNVKIDDKRLDGILAIYFSHVNLLQRKHFLWHATFHQKTPLRGETV